MLVNCKALHLVDPHFGPENPRHRKVLEALMDVLSTNGLSPDVIRVHCSAKLTLAFFEQEALKMASRLPIGISIKFGRWRQRDGARSFTTATSSRTRGVSLGVGLDAGEAGKPTTFFYFPRAVRAPLVAVRHQRWRL